MNSFGSLVIEIWKIVWNLVPRFAGLVLEIWDFAASAPAGIFILSTLSRQGYNFKVWDGATK
jgi:hypothetical protein